MEMQTLLNHEPGHPSHQRTNSDDPVEEYADNVPLLLFAKNSIKEYAMPSNHRLTLPAAPYSKKHYRPPFAPLSNEAFVATDIARLDRFWPWIPTVYHSIDYTWLTWRSKRSATLLLNAAAVLLVLTTNIAFDAWARNRYESSDGISVIYQGDCTRVKRLNTWLHLVINVLSTVMLGASNYCMQLQVAPTRQEIDKAHGAGVWLDIGIPSVRNLPWINKWRVFVWCLFLMTSLPVHLMYNSVFFTSLPSVDYTVAVVSPDFLKNDASWNITQAALRGFSDTSYSWAVWNDTKVTTSHVQLPGHSPEDVVQGMHNGILAGGNYTSSNISECIKAYATYWSKNGNLVLVTNNQSYGSNDTVLLYSAIRPEWDNWSKYQWANLTDAVVPSDRLGEDMSADVTVPDPWLVGGGPYPYMISYCYMQPAATPHDRCRFHYSSRILSAVCVFNFFKFCLILHVWYTRRHSGLFMKPILRLLEKANDCGSPRTDGLRGMTNNTSASGDDPIREKEAPLSTLGDAIASFMQYPDETTDHMCLATPADFRVSTNAVVTFKHWSLGPRRWKLDRRRWMESTSRRRWFLFLSMVFALLVVAASLLTTALTSLRSRISLTPAVLWQLGFGELTPYTFVQSRLPRKGTSGLICNVLVANTPQLIISIVYVLYNSILTCYMVQKEFSDMNSQSERQSLRVSEPQGMQRSTHFISLPIAYGLPYYIGSGVLHWLISQSMFLARVTAFFPDGIEDTLSSFSVCGVSPIAIVFGTFKPLSISKFAEPKECELMSNRAAITWGLVQVVILILLGLRRYQGEMPLGATCSAVISAACHPLPGYSNGESAPYVPLQWGIVSAKRGLAHCAFTTASDMRMFGSDDKAPPDGILFA